jgi:negative regulator of genetic competence, sporulation and motility
MGQETVKVTVSHTELSEYNILPGQITGDNADTHMFFVNLFGEIKRKFAVELKGMHLYLEVFTIMEDTTIIYISLMNEPDFADEEKYVYVYFSDRLEELAAAAGEIITMQPEISFESKFYISDEGYFLVIKSDFIVFRTNHAIGSGDYCAEYIEEHFKVIEEENAVGKLAKLLT